MCTLSLIMLVKKPFFVWMLPIYIYIYISGTFIYLQLSRLFPPCLFCFGVVAALKSHVCYYYFPLPAFFIYFILSLLWQKNSLSGSCFNSGRRICWFCGADTSFLSHQTPHFPPRLYRYAPKHLLLFLSVFFFLGQKLVR